MMAMNNNFLFIFSHLFILIIELLFIIPSYVYVYDTSNYIIISFILQHLFLCIIILCTSQRSLFSMCYWCIWLGETLFQTRQTFILFLKESIWYSINIVSAEAPFCSWIQISNSQLYSLHDWHCQHCLLNLKR